VIRAFAYPARHPLTGWALGSITLNDLWTNEGGATRFGAIRSIDSLKLFLLVGIILNEFGSQKRRRILRSDRLLAALWRE